MWKSWKQAHQAFWIEKNKKHNSGESPTTPGCWIGPHWAFFVIILFSLSVIWIYLTVQPPSSVATDMRKGQRQTDGENEGVKNRGTGRWRGRERNRKKGGKNKHRHLYDWMRFSFGSWTSGSPPTTTHQPPSVSNIYFPSRLLMINERLLKNGCCFFFFFFFLVFHTEVWGFIQRNIKWWNGNRQVYSPV